MLICKFFTDLFQSTDSPQAWSLVRLIRDQTSGSGTASTSRLGYEETSKQWQDLLYRVSNIASYKSTSTTVETIAISELENEVLEKNKVICAEVLLTREHFHEEILYFISI